MTSLSTLVPSNYVLTSGVNSAMTWSNVLTLSTANCSTVNASSIVTNSIGANVVTLNSTLSVSTLTARTVNYSSITGSSISSNSMTLSLTNVSTQNTQIYQVATSNPTTSYTVIQASHVSTGTTNNALVINPSGGNVGVGTTAPLTSFHILNSTADASSQLDNTPTSHILLRNTKTGSTPYSMGLGVDQTTGAGYINAAGNGAIQPVCLQTRGGNVGIGTSAPGSLLTVATTNATDAIKFINTFGSSTGTIALAVAPTAGTFIVNGSADAGIILPTDGKDLFLNRDTSLNCAMVVKGGTGRVGIGMSTPGVPLHVAGSATINTGSTSWLTKGSGGVATSGGSTFTTVSIYAVGSIWAGDVIGCAAVTSFSDQRIKENIQLVSAVFDLIRQVDIVSYDHIDVRKKSVKIGVVAQQLQSFFPEIVDKAKNWVTVPYSYATSHERQGDHVIIMVDASASELQVGRQIRLYISHNDMETQYDTDIIELTPGSITCKVWGDKYDAADRVFVYGVEVDDFLVVDKTQLGLLALAGVKEMDHTMEALQTKHEALQAKHEALQAKHEALQAQHEALQSQLGSLLAWAQTMGYSASS